jgi:ABC-2 type transport system ATP-binding protein
MATERPIIEIDDLSFSYGEMEVIKRISFTVERGEILGFLGPNGAGKTTTAKLITGQLIAASGSIRVFGVDMTKNYRQVLGRIGVSFESPNLYPKFSGFDNLAIFARLHGLGTTHIPELLKQVELNERGKDRVSSYSKGTQQRLVFARALVNHPELLILDEPTVGLDPVGRALIHQLLRHEQNRGTTIFITSHDMWEIDELCDRVIFLNEGQIVANDSPEVLKQQHGKPFVEVGLKDGADIRKVSLPLYEPQTADQIAQWIRQQELVTIHSQEATLGQVFIKLAGRSLDDEQISGNHR